MANVLVFHNNEIHNNERTPNIINEYTVATKTTGRKLSPHTL